jgi:uncharacterized protein YfiM (DUF2279 family)
MNGCAILVALVLSCAGATGDTTAAPILVSSPAPAQAADTARRRVDPWLAEDKLRHFAMSFAATAFAYGGARTALDPDPAMAVAAAAALAAGIGKEVHDARAGQWFSWPDMAWNVAGVALGLVFIHQIR